MQDNSSKADISIDMDLRSSQQMQLLNEKVVHSVMDFKVVNATIWEFEYDLVCLFY